ncbi:MAG: Txe/YoeB family addiction module toxin [Melioribacteraceae bacterium]|nr:Txe/YoeB family addiction module toxin [Melioribacteraceae bacterium]MCF8353427.1 Txe/YoeB family addiction module toxin [Melioribacteraceae bacterium]MCF8393915.1 Txe/YoeB family addiction module toxin [Melioribacteraceae bacterium]MCF8418988.1 Txe/YoeB family addiction module toxin [Melioribacteraceae bacterium]
MPKKRDIIWSPESLRQIKKIKSNIPDAEKYLQKIAALLESVQKSPFKGIGKPEPLKHKFEGCWSRRINIRDRLIYSVDKNSINIISILGHYDS